jgi:DNA-binding NarL/FixJ family response regulator
MNLHCTPNNQPSALVEKLSPRELEVLTLLNKGCSVKEAASMMAIKETTARTLVMRAYKKLGANNLQTALYETRLLILT